MGSTNTHWFQAFCIKIIFRMDIPCIPCPRPTSSLVTRLKPHRLHPKWECNSPKGNQSRFLEGRMDIKADKETAIIHGLNDIEYPNTPF